MKPSVFFKWPVPALFPPGHLNTLLLRSHFPAQTANAFIPPCLLMQSELTLLAAGISIVLQYMNSSMEQPDRANRTLRASRCENFEEILKGCTIILECCGRADYLTSIYQLWALCSNAMYLFEQQWWPDQHNETRMHVAAPPIPLKLSALLRPGWRDQHHLIRLAMASLVTLRNWFMDFFDDHTHRDVLNTIRDALLVFQTAVDLFELHQAVHEPPAPVLPAIEDQPVRSTPDAPASTGGS